MSMMALECGNEKHYTARNTCLGKGHGAADGEVGLVQLSTAAYLVEVSYYVFYVLYLLLNLESI
jgi:hypothetical protein